MTLIELLVVMGIIGMLVAISVPGLSGYGRQVRLKSATRQVLGLLSLARSVAISSHEDHAVVIDREAGELSIVKVSSGEALEHVVRLPSSIRVDLEVGGEPSAEAQLVFRPTGSLTGRTTSLVLADDEHEQTILITGPTGAVSVQ